MIHYERFIFNLFGENSYVVWADGGEALLVDVGCYGPAEQQRLADFIAQKNLTPTMALCTHAHPDHVAGAAWARERYGISVALHSDDNPLAATLGDYGARFGFRLEPLVADVDLKTTTQIRLGDHEGRIIHTPGHSLGGVCLYFAEQELLFSGDTLFAGSIGRTDLQGGDYDQLMDSLVERVMPLGRGVKVLPGHGPETTIAREMDSNPFITEVLDGGFNRPMEQ